jgi:hypothetical protein
MIGDVGLLNLMPALLSSEIVSLDLTNNGLTNKCAATLYNILRENQSIL